MIKSGLHETHHYRVKADGQTRGVLERERRLRPNEDICPKDVDSKYSSPFLVDYYLLKHFLASSSIFEIFLGKTSTVLH